MTLGAKIKEARKEYGMSQEQLAEKLSVSRSAVAKWEAGNGMPDVDNLKALALLFDVSVDYLLADEAVADKNIIRENISLELYGKGSKSKKKERIIRERFPSADIYNLFGEQKLTKGERVVDNLLGFLTDVPFGTPQLINSFKNADKVFYLAEESARQFFVMITDEFIEIRRLSLPVTGDRFELGNFKFKKSKYKIK